MWSDGLEWDQDDCQHLFQEVPMASTTTKEMKLTDARAHFSELLTEVHREGIRISITKSGIPVGAIISTSDLERFTRLEAAEREKDFEVFHEAGRALSQIPDDEFEQELAKARREYREKTDHLRTAVEDE
jgi:prevent-host-death family protein